MTTSPDDFASRAGAKLDHAIERFGIDVAGFVCADLGSNAGGFVDCLLRRGAERVFAIERGYGVLDYRLRSAPRVTVMERTDARHVRLSQPVDLVTIDVGWTRQAIILPPACGLLRPGGEIVSLIKPHYEAQASALRDGVLPDDRIESVLASVRSAIAAAGVRILDEVESPIRGHGGNREFLWRLRPVTRAAESS